MKREELMPFEWDDAEIKDEYVYVKNEADSVMDALEQRIKSLQEENLAKDMAGAELHNENKDLRHNLEDYKCENEALKCKIEEIQNEDVLKDTVRVTLSNENQTLKEKIKELEADKLRQENYCESLVNENKRISEKLETRIAMWEHEKNLRKDIANDWAKAQDRIKELEEDLEQANNLISVLEANQPNEYKEEKYFYTRLVNWLDKNEKGRVNPHHESGCPAIFKELTTKAQNEWKELADKLLKASKIED